MSITNTLLSWTSHPHRWKARMTADADRLIATHGDAAYATAADLAWREDMGLVRSADAGHWSRVTLEIGRRMAVAETAFAAPRPPLASNDTAATVVATAC